MALQERSLRSNPELAFGNSADPVKVFWARFLGNDPAPVIAYPDAVFLLDDSNDLFRFRQGASDDRGALVDPHLAQQFASNPSLVAKAGQLYYENGYTGTGELQGIAMLTSLFGQMGVKATIKPSRDITPDDLRQHNVILLGSPFQNIAVAQLISMGDFKFENPDSRHEEWRAQILNAHPRADESSTYRTERDPSYPGVEDGLQPHYHTVRRYSWAGTSRCWAAWTRREPRAPLCLPLQDRESRNSPRL